MVHGTVAQLAEHRTFNPRVVGSSPTGPTLFQFVTFGESPDNHNPPREHSSWWSPPQHRTTGDFDDGRHLPAPQVGVRAGLQVGAGRVGGNLGSAMVGWVLRLTFS